MDLLILLVERRGHLVSYREIKDRLWPDGVNVEVETAVHTAIRTIRNALRDSPEAPTFIATIPGKGYRFIAAVEIVGAQHGAQNEAASARLPAGSYPDVMGIGQRASGSATTDVEASQNHQISVRVHTNVAGESVDVLLTNYRTQRQTLRRNLLLQFTFVVCGILVVFYGASNTTLTVLGTTVSTSWVSFVVPIILVYLWLEFGFVFDDLIKWRAEAWWQLREMRNMTLASAFNDGGIMDGWFLCSRPTEHGINTRFRIGSAFFFCLMYPPLFAASHACAITLLLIGTESYISQSGGLSLLQILSLRFLPWLCLAVIALSHLQFRFGGPHPNWIQPFIALISVVLIYLFSFRILVYLFSFS